MSEVRTTRAQTAKKRRRRRPSTPTDVLRDNARAHAADQLRKARERRRRSTGKRRAAQFALAVTAVLGFTFYLGGFFELAARNLDEAARAKLVEAGFVLRHVDVHGAERASSDDIARALMLEPGELLFELDPAAARRSLLTMPLVRDATVIRLYPNRVAVIVDERAPVAVWRRPGGAVLIDDRGAPIDGADPRAEPGLLMIAGAEAPAAAPDLVAGLAAAPDIARHIALAERVGGRRWDLLTHDGVRVRLPEGAAGAGLARLVALERRESVLRAELEVVDLRGAGVVLRARVQAPVRAREV